MAGYVYEEIKPQIITPEGMRAVLKMSHWAEALISKSGAVRAEELMRESSLSDAWQTLATIDFLCEVGELKLVQETAKGVWQQRVFVAGHALPTLARYDA